MTIQEMHTLFRVIGQQQGMQAIRAILLEDIDAFLNTAIVEKCRSIIVMNTSTQFPDKASIRDNSISPVNALRTLVRRLDIPVGSTPSKTYFINLDADNVMLFTSFDVDYQNKSVACRFVENDKLGETLRDYCNSATWEYPILTIYEGKPLKAKLITNSTVKVPITLGVNYIANPAKVSYSSNISCDLPEYLHEEIVREAVNLFFQSVGSTTQSISS